jgi:hypothetical protein
MDPFKERSLCRYKFSERISPNKQIKKMSKCAIQDCLEHGYKLMGADPTSNVKNMHHKEATLDSCTKITAECYHSTLPDLFEIFSYDADECSSDSDCSFYEIESHGHSLVQLDLEEEDADSVDSVFTAFSQPNCSLLLRSEDHRRYRAWVGSRSLHMA